MFRLLGGSAKISVDLVASTTAFDPTITKRGLPFSGLFSRQLPASPTILGNILETDCRSRICSNPSSVR